VLEGSTMNTTFKMDNANGKRASSKKLVIVLVQWLWALGMIIVSIMNIEKEVGSPRMALEYVVKSHHKVDSMTLSVGSGSKKHNEY